MKIERVKLRNLNSLVGAHEVDFYPEKAIDGNLCLISGPTGAGKSTLFDAICLALYDETPRYNGKNTVERTKPPIVTTGRNNALAEVVFSENGKKYKAVWSLQKGKSKDSVSKFLYEIGKDTPIAGGDDVQRQVQAVTKMDYQQFQRIVMLSQGEFAKFMGSPDKEKTAILEKLTNSGIYREISKEVRRRLNDAEAGVKDKSKEIDKLKSGLSSEKNCKERETRVSELADAIQKMREEMNGLGKKVAWLDETGKLEAERQEFENWRNGFAEKAAMLENAERARGVGNDEEYRKYCMDRAEKVRLETELPKQKEAWEKSVRDYNAAVEDKAKAEQVLKGAQESQAQLKALLAEVGKAEALKEEARAAAETLRKVVKLAGEELEKCEKAIDGERTARSAAEGRKIKIESWQKAHEAYQGITALLGALSVERRQFDMTAVNLADARVILKDAETKIQNLAKARDDANKKRESSEAKVKQLETDIGRLEQAYEQVADGQVLEVLRGEKEQLGNKINEYGKLAEQKKALDELQTEIKASKDKLSAADGKLKELSAAKDEAEQALKLAQAREAEAETAYNLARKVEDYRGDLKEGEPCPLCGSTNHPFCNGGEPPVVSALKERLNECKTAVKACEKDCNTVNGACISWKSDIEHLNGTITYLMGKDDRQKSQFDAMLARLGLAGKPDSQVLEADKGRLENQLAGLASKVDRLDRLNNEKNGKMQELNDEQRKYNDFVQKAATAQRQFAENEKIMTDKTAAINEMEKQVDAFKKECSGHAAVYGIILDTDSQEWCGGFMGELLAREKEWKDNREALEKVVRDIGQCASRIEDAEKRLPGLRAAKTNNDADLKDKEGVLKEREDTLADLFGGRDKAAETAAAQRKVTDADKAVDKIRKMVEDCTSARAACETNYTRDVKRFEELASDWAERTEGILGKVVHAGFENEETMQNARLDDGCYNELARNRKALADKEANLKGRAEQLERGREALGEIGKDDTPEVLRAQIDEKYKDVQAKEAEKTELLAIKLKEENDKKRIMELEEEVKTISPQYDLLKQLDALVGGNLEGDIFAKYAQSITLDLLLDKANVYMKDICPRYSLVRLKSNDANSNSLEIGVIDHYRQDDRRPASGASGGEKFMISLSLALGLSDMNSRDLKVESLFLDEGFGSLDRDTLQEVIDMLQRLRDTTRNSERKIFIISHVEALKEAIEEQILMEVVADRRSRIVCKNSR